MPRIHSARSDVSDGDVDGMAEKEQEFAKLQRQYRIMENDRKAYCQESQDLIKKQKQVSFNNLNCHSYYLFQGLMYMLMGTKDFIIVNTVHSNFGENSPPEIVHIPELK